MFFCVHIAKSLKNRLYMHISLYKKNHHKKVFTLHVFFGFNN